MLGKDSAHPSPSRNNPISEAFYGQFRCFKCNSSITPDKKINVRCTKCRNKFSAKHADACPECKTKISRMSKPVIREYVYYKCSKKKNPNCNKNQ